MLQLPTGMLPVSLVEENPSVRKRKEL